MSSSGSSIEVFEVSADYIASMAPDSSALETRLEQGNILTFPPGTIPIPADSELSFLRDELPKMLAFKNISYHPEGDYLTGMKQGKELRQRTKSILREHNLVVRPFLEKMLPHYGAGMVSGKVNFRPLEEKGRDLSVRASNELLHTDAMASGATHGDRIFRFFTNIHPSAVRIWKSAGRFPELLQEFASEAGLADLGPEALRANPAKRLFSTLLHRLGTWGLPQAAMALDNSPYDKLMRQFHNFLKENEEFQKDEARIKTFEFPPFYSWAVLTDMVSHAVISGRHALVNTFHIQLADCRNPELAPYHILSDSAA